MEGGGAVSGGIRRLRVASTAARSSSKKVGSFIVEGIGCEEEEPGRAPIWRLAFPGGDARSRFALAFGVERVGGEFYAPVFQENFDAAFGLLELLLAFTGERHAFFEELHGIV